MSRRQSAIERMGRLTALTGRVTGRVLKGTVRGALGDERSVAMSQAMEESATDLAERLGELKGAAMKVGQSLAMAADTLDLPPQVRQQLSALHREAEPVDFDVVARTITEELGVPPERRFADIDPVPIGTASLAQAHRARLKTGEDVVIKVLHPGVTDSVSTDLAALRALAWSGASIGRRQEWLAALDEIEARLREELDYHAEAANIERFRTMYADDVRLVIPRHHPEHSTARVLCLDHLDGMPLQRFLEVASPEARQRAGLTVGAVCLEGLFVRRLLHADPHPGNYLFTEDGTVQLLDFGCVKRIDEFWVATYARMVLAVLDDDRAAAEQAWRDLGLWSGRDPEASQVMWDMSRGIVQGLDQGPYQMGSPDDDRVPRVVKAARRVPRYRELHGTPELVFVHRTLSGIYSLMRQLKPTADWGALVRRCAEHAIAYADGQAPPAPPSHIFIVD